MYTYILYTAGRRIPVRGRISGGLRAHRIRCRRAAASPRYDKCCRMLTYADVCLSASYPLPPRRRITQALAWGLSLLAVRVQN